MTRCFLCNQCKISQKSFDIIISSQLNRVLGVFACLRACVFTCLRACVFGLLTCLRAFVLTCLRAYVLGVLTCVHASYNEMFYFLTCLRTWCIYTWCAFLSYFLYSLILKFKNSCSEKFVCFVKLNIFLIYKAIKLIKLFETNLREAGKSIDISYSCSCSKAISIFYNLYIHLLH